MTAPADVRDLTAGDGTLLRYRAWEPERPHGRVLIVHGLGEHSARYHDLAADLTAEGVSVFAPDLRGHGLSGGRRGDVPGFGHFLSDLDLVVGRVAGRGSAGEPLILLGHSMGGLIAIRYAQTRPAAHLAGLVLSAPQLALADPPPAWLRALAAAVGLVAPMVQFPNGIDAGQLSHDPVEVRAYREDPLVHDRITPRLFREMGRAMRTARREIGRTAATSALFIIPGADPVVDQGVNRSAAQELGRKIPVEVREYPDMLHEPLHEMERARVRSDLLGWMLPRIG